jgi:hypothetical protein
MITENELAIAFDHLLTESKLDAVSYAERTDEAYLELIEEGTLLSHGQVFARVFANFLAE